MSDADADDTADRHRDARADGREAVMTTDRPLVVETERCGPDDLGEVGGKAVGLGSLIRAGMAVPASFVVTAAAYRAYVSEHDASSPPDVARSGGSVGEHLSGPVADAYEQMWPSAGPPVQVAVRSSATVEDSSEASCAGQFRTHLGAAGAAEVVAEVERCWISAFEPHVQSYRSDRQVDASDDGVAVIVQELVDARAAGVMFTQHPRTGDRSLVVIEASYGLGEAVVGGEVTPDLFEVNKVTGQIQTRHCGSKPFEYRLAADRRSVERQPVSESRRPEWSISDEEIATLLSMSTELESSLGRGLDIEWAIGTTGGGEETLYALQVRPITVSSRPAASEAASAASSGAPGEGAIGTILGRLSGRGSAVVR